MNGQQVQRIVLAATMVLGATAALGAGQIASAKDAVRVSDFGTKAAFEASCEVLGGSFSEDGIGNTNCDADDGGWTQCDANGNDCWYTPPDRLAPQTGGQSSQIDGTIISAPIVVGSTPRNNHQVTKAQLSGGHDGKKHGHHGKKHKR